LFGPIDFETLVQAVLSLIEDKHYQRTPASKDGGVDLFFEEKMDLEDWDFSALIRTVVQCKLYRGYVSISDIRDFFGVMSAQTATGLFITTGKITSAAESFIGIANSSPHSNRFHGIAHSQWNRVLSLAERIYEQLHQVDDDLENAELLAIADSVEALKSDGKAILYARRDSPSQGQLL
jgi:predicted helicase